MRLVRYIADGEVSLGVKSGDYVIGLSHKLSRKPESMVDLISEWDTLQREIGDILSDGSDKVPLSEVSLLAPIQRPGKFLAIGMNYQKHRAEAVDAGITPPRNQMWFTKQTTSINDPFGDVRKPDSTMMLDLSLIHI